MPNSWYRNYLPAWAQRCCRTKPKESPYRSFRPNHSNDENPAILGVRRVDLCARDNHDEHHTDHFFASKYALIVRRGEPFRVRLHFNRPYESSRDAVSFIFVVADEQKPNPGHGTLIGIVPESVPELESKPPSERRNEWRAQIESQAGNELSVLIKPAANCPVTEWRLEVDTKLLLPAAGGDDGGSRTYVVPVPLYVLFNPWCIDDQVYLGERDARKEYVQHDTTLIWRGSYNRLRPTVWKLGQFERQVLECSLKLLGTVGQLPASQCGDAVRVTRALSAAVNSVDDDGVLLGNWSEDFAGGTAPTKWSGSAEILQAFHKTQRPVKFAQCWVYAGVLTTVARALGIPSRVVSCYSSAHDAHGSLTVDIFIDAQNRTMELGAGDSIWNFHAWNEVWLRRPDLAEGPYGAYDGWQVVDATPQEPSDNMYRVGPAPVLAVKHGEIMRPYDCAFVYAEVNADRVYWRYNGPTQPIKLLRKDTLAIGHLISTKAVLQWEREDITDSYKFEENTAAERSTMLKALKQAGHAFSRYYLNDNFNDVEFELQLRDDIKVGATFSVVLQATNKSSEQAHSASGELKCAAVRYTGTDAVHVKSLGFELLLKPGMMEHVRMPVTFDEYYEQLTSQAAFNVSCSAQVANTDYEYFAQDDFRVRKPDIKISFEGAIVSRQTVNVTLRLENPLPIVLRKGVFTVEGPGINEPLKLKVPEVPVGGTATSVFQYVPPYAGKGTLVAKFACRELDDVDGYKYYEIEPRPQDIIALGNRARNSNPIIRRRTDVLP